MIKRLLSDKIKYAAKKMLIIAVTGPRQSGKSMSIRMATFG